MLKYIISLSWILFSFFSYSQQPQVHSIAIFIQSRPAIDKDKQAIDEMRKNIARFTDSKLGKEYIIGNPADANTEKTITDFCNIITKDDIAMFYFSGTGKYKGDELNMDIGGKEKPVKSVLDSITKKIPKTAIVIIECALREIEKDHDGQIKSHANIITKDNTKKLFFVKDKSQLVYIKAASPPKQPIHRSAVLGSFLLQSFKNNMLDEMGIEEDVKPSWVVVLDKTKQDISNITRNGQTPVVKYETYPK
ncbi:hypothetical protein [Emticicia sp. C21]|uniref:hypothetical protein n=1 Tax=Emticicia sp. C21 TaxID=2302915 RepID=UPI000E344A4E|nr:hypothetical protein [Emticicia sp. C21]RFS15578.1 hypothetical protein D0T08_15640 [Emticicia sp. C21]